jgi:hypothetical protein
MRYLVATALLVACKTNEKPPVARPTDVVLVKPGAAPLRAIRYAVPKGTHTTVELATDWKVTAGEIGNVMPTILTTFNVECEDVAADGSMKLQAKVIDATAHERADSAVAPASIATVLDPLKGTTFTLSLAPDGRVSPPVFEAAAGSGSSGSAGSAALDEQLQALAASFQQLAMSLPTAPIGVGAEWRTSRTIEQNGMHLTSVTTLDVTSLDAASVGFTLASEIHGADQTLTQAGMAVEIKDVGGNATGKGTIELTKGVTTGELHFDLHSNMTAAGSSTPMRAQTDIVIH